MLVLPAYAQTAGTTTEGFNFMSLIPFALIFVVMYFLLIRPQQKRARQQQEMLKGIHRGDKILTSGGIIATVTKVISDQELQIEISDGIQVRLMRPMVADVLSRSTTINTTTTDTPSSSLDKTNVRKLTSKKTKKDTLKKTK